MQNPPVNIDLGNGVVITSNTTQYNIQVPVTYFTIGVSGPCDESVSVTGQTYSPYTYDLTYGVVDPGIGSYIKLDWIYVGLAGGYQVFHREDTWEAYCNQTVIEINSQTSFAPC
jgi:hypothetical protein